MKSHTLLDTLMILCAFILLSCSNTSTSPSNDNQKVDTVYVSERKGIPALKDTIIITDSSISFVRAESYSDVWCARPEHDPDNQLKDTIWYFNCYPPDRSYHSNLDCECYKKGPTYPEGKRFPRGECRR